MRQIAFRGVRLKLAALPRLTAVPVLMMLLAGCGQNGERSGTFSGKLAPPDEKAPASFSVNFDSTRGGFVVEVQRAWSPIGADRFFTLVKQGFFDRGRFFRVVPGFVVQFGINGDPAVTAKWKDTNLKDDPVTQSNLRGFLSFATDGPDTRTTQLFINLADNARLDAKGFSPFGKVVSGMDVVDQIYAGDGEKPEQPLIESQGNAYLEKEFPKLNYIKSAKIAN